MSCLPGSPCFTESITSFTSSCGVDPCNKITLGTESVFYTGPNLPCTGINPCDSLTTALSKIDDAICNPPAFTFTANNGLTKTLSNVQLGGPLIQQTIITTSFANTLSLLGLVIDTTPAFILSENSSGVIRKTAYSTVLPITANNGLTMNTSTNVQLGGTLIKPTTVTTDVTNTLSITGLQTDATPDFIVTETTAGVVKKISTTTLTSNILSLITADNGLTKTGNNIQLGGTLITNTTIDMDGSFFQVADYNDPDFYSFYYADKTLQYLQAGFDPIAHPTGSFTRTINYRSSAALFLTNINSSAYDAQAKYLIAHPWIGTMAAGTDFQIVDYCHAVNTASAIVASYLDERVDSPFWNESWSAASTGASLNPTYPATWPGWVIGDHYTLRTKVAGDNFPAGMGTTVSGTANTSGWVFISNGTPPTTWTNGSIIDGDYPVISLDARNATIVTDRQGVAGAGRVGITASRTDFNSGIRILNMGTNIPVFLNEAAATGAGLTSGDVYRIQAIGYQLLAIVS